MSNPTFKNIAEHWNHFLECDIPPNAPPVQVHAMKRAFAAGAISGLQLGMIALRDEENDLAAKDALMKIARDIEELVKP